MVFVLDPLPEGHPRLHCSRFDELREWPYVRYCKEPAVGLVPYPMARVLDLRLREDRAVCLRHHQLLDEELG